MSYFRFDEPVRPRNGHTLVVGVFARISGCENQKEISLDDQVAHAEQVIREMWSGPIEWRVVKVIAKGERIDRPELTDCEAGLRKREMDIWFQEDIGRLVRGIEAVRLWGIAVDHGTRCLSPHDALDTADEGWQEAAMNACAGHAAHNEHTSRRIKMKLMLRFRRNGEITGLPIAGYIVPDDAEGFEDWRKDDAWTQVMTEGKRLARETLNGPIIADYFNQAGFPVGPYCKNPLWDGTMVRRFFGNTLLKGYPERGNKHNVKHNETGRRRPVKNPKGPQHYHAPHLAWMDPVEFDDLNAAWDAKYEGWGRRPVNGADPLQGIRRKDTLFPGGHSRCWYCGRVFIWGANGLTHSLMCPGARKWWCWNSIGFSGPLATKLVLREIFADLDRLDGIHDQYRDLVGQAHANVNVGVDQQWQQFLRDEQRLQKVEKNLGDLMREVGRDPIVLRQLEELNKEKMLLAGERHRLELRRGSAPVVPSCAAELRDSLHQQLEKLAVDSPEMGHLLRRLTPNFHVYVVRAIDGGHLYPRAKVTLALDGLTPDAAAVQGLPELLRREVTLDLFEPPQRIRILADVQRYTAMKVSQRQMRHLIEEKPTLTAVQRTAALDRKLQEQALTTPYTVVTEPPSDYTKLRKHLNKKFKFTPLEGYEPPAI